jgi:hypothetical protein
MKATPEPGATGRKDSSDPNEYGGSPTSSPDTVYATMVMNSPVMPGYPYVSMPSNGGPMYTTPVVKTDARTGAQTTSVYSPVASPYATLNNGPTMYTTPVMASPYASMASAIYTTQVIENDARTGPQNKNVYAPGASPYASVPGAGVVQKSNPATGGMQQNDRLMQGVYMSQTPYSAMLGMHMPQYAQAPVKTMYVPQYTNQPQYTMASAPQQYITQPQYAVASPSQQYITQPQYAVASPSQQYITQPQYAVASPPQQYITQPQYTSPPPQQQYITQPQYAVTSPPQQYLTQTQYTSPPPQQQYMTQPQYAVTSPPQHYITQTQYTSPPPQYTTTQVTDVYMSLPFAYGSPPGSSFPSPDQTDVAQAGSGSGSGSKGRGARKSVQSESLDVEDLSGMSDVMLEIIKALKASKKEHTDSHGQGDPHQNESGAFCTCGADGTQIATDEARQEPSAKRDEPPSTASTQQRRSQSPRRDNPGTPRTPQRPSELASQGPDRNLNADQARARDGTQLGTGSPGESRDPGTPTTSGQPVYASVQASYPRVLARGNGQSVYTTVPTRSNGPVVYTGVPTGGSGPVLYTGVPTTMNGGQVMYTGVPTVSSGQASYASMPAGDGEDMGDDPMLSRAVTLARNLLAHAEGLMTPDGNNIAVGISVGVSNSMVNNDSANASNMLENEEAPTDEEETTLENTQKNKEDSRQPDKVYLSEDERKHASGWVQELVGSRNQNGQTVLGDSQISAYDTRSKTDQDFLWDRLCDKNGKSLPGCTQMSPYNNRAKEDQDVMWERFCQKNEVQTPPGCTQMPPESAPATNLPTSNAPAHNEESEEAPGESKWEKGYNDKRRAEGNGGKWEKLSDIWDLRGTDANNESDGDGDENQLAPALGDKQQMEQSLVDINRVCM